MRVHLQILSSIPSECLETDNGRLLKTDPEGFSYIEIDVQRVHPETGERQNGVAIFRAFPKQGKPDHFVCGDLASMTAPVVKDFGLTRSSFDDTGRIRQ